MRCSRISNVLPFVLSLISLGAVSTGRAQVAPNPVSVDFGAVAVGAASKVLSVSFTFESTTTVGGISAVTQGTANGEYRIVASGTTCGAGTFSMTTCTVRLEFVPQAPGSRWGALILSDGSGNALTTIPLFGIGNAPMLGFPPGIISTVIGGDVAGTTVGLNYPNGVGADAAGNVYVGDTGHNAIHKLSKSGVTTTIAGGNGQGYSGDGGPATSAQLYYPTTIRLDGAGNIYFVDDGNNAVRMINPAGIIMTVAGLAPGASICAQATDAWGDGCPATQASLDFIDSYYGEGGTATDAAGNLYIGDTAHNLIRKVGPDGTISIFAGTGTAGYSGDGGPATSAQLDNPDGGVFDGAGNFYFADLYNNVIRKIATDGTISTVAGTGAYGHSGDGGPATQAELGYPYQVAIDPAGDLYITDSGNFTEGDQHEVIRKVTPDGTITPVAGTDPSSTYGGDGGPATSAQMWGPVDIVLDAKGNLYIADDYNHAIRKVDVSDPPSLLTFADTNFRTVSAPQDVVVESLGNVPWAGSRSVPANFTVNDPDTTCALNRPLAPAANCTIGIEFAPQAAGPLVGTLKFVVKIATPTITLQGNGLQDTPSVTWATPAPITYGRALSKTQLNARATYNGKPVTGTFVYTPGVGTILNEGPNTLQVVFSPTNAGYTSADGSVTLQVKQATPIITWSNPSPIAVGTALSATQLDATANTSGTYLYSPPLGTVLPKGIHTLSVTFTPDDTTDYTTAVKSVKVAVNP